MVVKSTYSIVVLSMSALAYMFIHTKYILDLSIIGALSNGVEVEVK